MTLNMITEFEGKRDTTISTHTYIPRIEWDPKLYDLYQGSKYDYKATQGTYQIFIKTLCLTLNKMQL